MYDAEVIRRYQRRLAGQWLLAAAAIAGAALIWFSGAARNTIDPGKEWALAAGVALLVLALALHIATWRCPRCGRALGRNPGPKCSGCAARFQKR
jgi:protein-S-isoprenylcysteine O-methyltransferase Ste14